ncbi:hypothetical protein ERO13_D05G360200v2 [Gossypium hirsutum]|uniref:Peroxisomal membrane protein 2 n=5 Tax=Gossypium TaxID=3633 RepID=A0A5D2V6P1_GOSMU|nr:uncharacterized protein LOC107903543 isoform X1 [Gossypium hirsutum]KAB2032786.1 hypothetical protein ES319_D05G401500v1 [Gossypium barbadense]TYG71817.1 hypothetical protein ES288_D05G429400v1 [Gossypium darwinii]TYH74690.1 hypothetical protein ES332_D05G419100v1 [Gossypium tomentosum]TYI85046.1 hypothetical protein E1A91_D05G410800v1 [Gossypium mustelinum]KAG4149881.1 hypothetical protein ERO13_D05G360200v2 [Gossypium hirsutum]
MASLHPTISPQSLLSLTKPRKPISRHLSASSLTTSKLPEGLAFSGTKQKNKRENSVVVVKSLAEELDVIPVQSEDVTDMQEGVAVSQVPRESAGGELVTQVGGFSNEGMLSFEGVSSSGSPSGNGFGDGQGSQEELDRLIDRTINATIVLAAGTYAITKLLTIDQNYWQGWTIYEIVRYAPQHNWSAYEEALRTNPVLAKMVISGIVYSIGDWIAQCFEGKPLFEFDRMRMFRSGLVGFTLHGSLSHYYYQFCEELFPFQDWWVVPVKVAFDQTAWAAVWNSIYFVVLGFLRLESPISIFNEWKATFLPMLTAGWKLWPFAHLITYGFIPVEQRLLWVDCVELIWVTILSTYSNEKSEARISEAAPAEASSILPPVGPPEQE